MNKIQKILIKYPLQSRSSQFFFYLRRPWRIKFHYKKFAANKWKIFAWHFTIAQKIYPRLDFFRECDSIYTEVDAIKEVFASSTWSFFPGTSYFGIHTYLCQTLGMLFNRIKFSSKRGNILDGTCEMYKRRTLCHPFTTFVFSWNFESLVCLVFHFILQRCSRYLIHTYIFSGR